MPHPDSSLKQRLQLYKVDAATMEAARKFWHALHPEFHDIAERFYIHLQANPQSARFLPGPSGIDRLKAAQEAHWGALFTGYFGASFVERVRRAAEAHIRIRLPNYLYMSAYAFFLNELVASAQHLYTDAHEQAEVICAINKLVMMDADLTMSFYMQRLMQGRQEDAALHAASA